MKIALSHKIGGKHHGRENSGNLVSVQHAPFPYISREVLESQDSYGVRWNCLNECLLKHKPKFD